MSELRILGIDPGTIRLGFGLLTGPVNRPQYLASGILVARSSLPSIERLGLLQRQLNELLATHRPDAVAVESSFHGKNVQALIRLGEARGMVIATASALGLAVSDYSPAMVKKAVTGRGNATKEGVARMVAALLPQAPGAPALALPRRAPATGKSSAPLDHMDALAVALCHLHRVRMQSLAVRR